MKPNLDLSFRDVHLAVVAFDVAIADLARKGRTEHPAFQGYLESRRKFAAAINENAKPPAYSPRPALEGQAITPESVTAFLGRRVTRIRDKGGKVVLAWIEGTGCRFVSRRKVMAFEFGTGSRKAP